MTIVDGYLWGINGIISPSIVSNGLKVEIKDFDGTDFSTSKPLVHKIGGTPRTLTAALNITATAGFDLFNTGAVEFATLGVDYFVYLGWRAASSTVFILISRIPYARTYADFSAVSGNEKYGYYSGSAPASTDNVENIGRIRAINSGTASYNWSLPATQVNVQRPIYETDWLSWAEQFTGYSANPVTVATYKVDGDMCWVTHAITSPGTSNNTASTLTFPFAAGVSQQIMKWIGVLDNGATGSAGHLQCTAGSATISAYKTFYQGAWTNSGAKAQYFDTFAYRLR